MGPSVKEERVGRSAMEIYQSGDEYLVGHSANDKHMYYSKITAYADYVSIIMNRTTLIYLQTILRSYWLISP